MYKLITILLLSIISVAAKTDSTAQQMSTDSTSKQQQTTLTTLLHTQPTVTPETDLHIAQDSQTVNFTNSTFAKKEDVLVIDGSTILSTAFISTVYFVGDNETKDYVNDKVFGNNMPKDPYYNSESDK